MLVDEIVEFNAERMPEREAVIFEDGSRQTWSQLHDFAERIADLLVARGLAPGERVAVLSRNALELYGLYVGANRAGVIHAPLNYRYAVPELLQVLRDCTPSMVLVHRGLADVGLRLRDELGDGPAWMVFGGPAAGFEALEPALAKAPPRRRRHRGRPEDPSWICYTGGTTGRSKGVVLTHRNMLSTAHNLALCNGIRADDTYLVAGALFHVALAVPIGFWLAGARTVVVNFEPGTALDVMAREGVTRFVATGTIFKMLIDEMSARPRALRLRNIDFGGAPISVQLARRARDVFGCTVAQIYGLSETSLMATYLFPEEYEAAWTRDPDGPPPRRLTSVGRAAPTLLVRILGPSGERLANGEIGEVAVRGDSVTPGYWANPELTAQALQDGWLRTGDLGRMDDDGYLYLVDRIKDVIITGGENVYSSEVELVLVEHPAVAEAVVVGRPDEHWGEAVHAVVVPHPGQSPQPDELRRFCRERLAGYKVPRTFELRDGLPRLPTGKIAKGALREELRPGAGNPR